MKQDRILALILLAFSVFMYLEADRLPPAMFGALGADLFPKLLFVLLALAAVTLFVQPTVKLRRKAAQSKRPASGAVARAFDFTYYRNVIIGFVAFLGYVVLMYVVGYVLSSLIFLPVLMWILGPRTKKSTIAILVVTFGLTFGMYFGFAQVLKIFLPSGLLF
jgi:putative tricarboxylic transport membrane protein